MLEPKASRFWQLSLQSGLMDAQGLQACWDAVPPEKRVIEHIDRRLARQAVQLGYLTLWQAQQLVTGRSSGFKIDRYVLLELIGQGGMGRVYLAKDTRLNRRVAVKILSPERVNNPRAIARFQREATVGAQLQHENLVRIYDVGENTGKCYLVMEYIEGKNIGQMIAENGPIAAATAARLTRQVALGLEHAQRKGLIHRDVNPYNILVTRDGIAKLTDMGLAIDLADSERVTRDGATVGTFDYVSPEQARHSHSVDTRSDIYSLGCTLYHMLAGQVPFPTSSLPEKLIGHQQIQPERLIKLVPGIPKGLEAVVMKMMRKVPDERYSTPLELALALEPFTDEGVFNGSVAGARPPLDGKTSEQINLVPTKTQQISTPINQPITELAYGSQPVAVAILPETVVAPAPPQSIASEIPKPVPKKAPTPSLPEVSSSDGFLGLGLAVDLGPEPPLSGGLTSGRTKPKSKTKFTLTPSSTSVDTAQATALDFWKRRPELIVAGVVVLLLFIGGFEIAKRVFKITKPDSTVTARPPGVGSTKKQGALHDTGNNTQPSAVKATRLPEGKEVAVVAADGSMIIEADLVSAMRAAIGRKGHVLLSNTSPLKISAAEAIALSGGLLVIKAKEGVKPELDVEVSDSKPFLATQSDTQLRFEGITIRVSYPSAGSDLAPVIAAGNNVVLDRCALISTASTPGSRAVVVDGGALTATGCWFENFDIAIDVATYSGSSTSLRQCIFVNSPRGETLSEGAAVRLRQMPGGVGKPFRRLQMQRCTAITKRLVELAGFYPGAPATVELANCAVLSDSILSWGPGPKIAGVTDPTPPAPNRDALIWAGVENQYDLRTEAWVQVVRPEGPVVPMAEGPTNLEMWTKLLATENSPILAPVRFATDTSTLSRPPEPSDYTVTSQGLTTAGADTNLVGPADPKP